MTGSTYFERALYKTGVPVVFDFDDAIWLMDVSDGNRRLSWLKDPGKTDRILGHVHHVIAGNEFLAEYARKHNKSVEVIPTVINTEKYRSAVSTGNSRPIVIGWTGSRTTIGGAGTGSVECSLAQCDRSGGPGRSGYRDNALAG